MAQTALLNKIFKSPLPPFIKGGLWGVTGFTLVEVLISLVVLLLVSLALMQTALVSIDANMINVLRDEAVGIAEMRMNAARNTAFVSLASDSTSLPAGVDCPAAFTDGSGNGQRIQRNIRNVSNKDFCTRLAVTGSGDTRQINVEVKWNWKENPYTHRIMSIVRRQ
ncbi:MAG: prepilin-type N-terminal cleavage/methylation domain-containing protein [Thermodesulfovibrionales bacterium]|nr:prepilin-type N-terminal cleavage/methylation domain-containing protein [Planctomycetota bacterium]MBU4319773.1 prepilin-type N-terminal cleavage/methylation domain-containing protein [Nitrospinota bacterium]MDP3048275.1 prepilin-type N-terminal cleavage/methylation domain-containing protein [Thermodesulfovibrionales bacterium]